jgi:hypothetical protein
MSVKLHEIAGLSSPSVIRSIPDRFVSLEGVRGIRMDVPEDEKSGISEIKSISEEFGICCNTSLSGPAFQHRLLGCGRGRLGGDVHCGKFCPSYTDLWFQPARLIGVTARATPAGASHGLTRLSVSRKLLFDSCLSHIYNNQCKTDATNS